MGLDDRRQATGRDSGECPKTVTHVSISQSRECTVMRKVFTFARDGVVDHCVSQNATPDHENSEQLVQIP